MSQSEIDPASILVIGEQRRESDADTHDGSAWAERLLDLLVARAPERPWRLLDHSRPAWGMHQVWEQLADLTALGAPEFLLVHAGHAEAVAAAQADELDAGAERYRSELARILLWCAAELPATRVIVIAPALCSCEDSAYNDRGRDTAAVAAYARAAGELCAEHGVTCLPLHKRFQAALARFGREALGRDLHHPAQFGSILIAEHLLRLILGEDHLPRVTDHTEPTSTRKTWLFIGDSITDCGRAAHRHPLGVGYLRLFNELARSRRPDLDLAVINRGVGGNVVGDLAARFQEDCLAHEPDLVAIKIGINDCNRFCSSGNAATGPDEYERIYRELLERLRAARGDIPLLLIGPFYCSADGRDDSYPARVAAQLPEYIDRARSLAHDFDARFIDSHARFAAQLRHRRFPTLAPDRVHPTSTGVAVLAEAVYDTLIGDDELA